MATKHGSRTFCLQAVDTLALPLLPASATPCPPLQSCLPVANSRCWCPSR